MMDQYTMFITTRYFDTIDDHINLVMSSKKFEKNMEKFFYNPVSINVTTRPFFTNLRTLYIYKPNDNLFENDPNIVVREYYCIGYEGKCIKRLEEITQMIISKWIFDSSCILSYERCI